jgi:hypothetical protein
MLHINFLPIESSTPRALMTEQLPLPFMNGHQQVRVQYRFLRDSTPALRARTSRRLDVFVAAVMTGQRMSQPQKLTVAEVRQRMNTQAIRKALALESGASHV